MFNNDCLDALHLKKLESEYFIQNKLNAKRITNLSNKDRFKLNQCIIEFNLFETHFIDKAYDLDNYPINNYFGFYSTIPFCDLTKFWNRFNKLKGRV